MIVFLAFILWIPTLFTFVVGCQLVWSIQQWGVAERPAPLIMALNLCEPAVNFWVIALFTYGHISNWALPSGIVPFAITAPMAVLLLIGIGLWSSSLYVRHIAKQAFALGLLRWMVTTTIWGCSIRFTTNFRTRTGTIYPLSVAMVLIVVGVCILIWCGIWGQRILKDWQARAAAERLYVPEVR